MPRPDTRAETRKGAPVDRSAPVAEFLGKDEGFDLQIRLATQPLGLRLLASLLGPTGSRVGPLAGFLIATLGVFGMIPQRLATRSAARLAAMSWESVFLVAGLGSFVAALFYWWVGGATFIARLRWCGGAALDNRSARVVYFATVAPQAITLACMTALLPTIFSTPSDFATGYDPLIHLGLPLLSHLLLLIGCVVLYLMVTQGLGARRGRAALWFVLAPLGYYLVQLTSVWAAARATAAAAAIASAMPASTPPPLFPPPTMPVPGRIDDLHANAPAVASSVRFRDTSQSDWNFHYPGNWTVHAQGPERDRNASDTIVVRGPDGSWISLSAPVAGIPADGDEAQIEGAARPVIDAAIESHRHSSAIVADTLLTHYERFDGFGRRVTLERDGERRTITAFAFEHFDALALIIVEHPEPDLANGGVGHKLIVWTVTTDYKP